MNLIIFKDVDFNDIAYSNLQWIYELNSSITRDNIKIKCIVFDVNISGDIALFVSMI